MEFEFTFEQKMIQKTASKIFDKYYHIEEIRNLIESPSMHSMRSDFLHEMSESGFIGIMASENGGGLGLGAVDALPILIEAGKSLVPFPILESIIASKILSSESPEMVEPIILGEKVVTISWDVIKDAQYDPQTMQLSADCKIVPFAGLADIMLVPLNIAKDGENPKIQLVCLDLRDENISTHKIDSMDLTYPVFSVSIENYVIKHEQLVGNIEDGNLLYQLMQDLGALFLSAEMLGAAERSLKTAIDYTKERVQFGQQIGKFQALKHIAAESKVKLESIRAATEYAAWSFDQGDNDHSICIAKGYTSEAALKILQNAVQMHGGIGFTWENETHFFLKRVLRSSHTLGDSYSHLEAIAADVIG